MTYYWIQLILTLFFILFSAQLFTNALEHFGEKIKISAGATGSIFAAIATASPETLIPILAIVAGGDNAAINQDISVGAILGAPLMLSTLSIAILSFFILKKRGLTGKMHPETTGLIRDLNFFLVAFFIAGAAMYVPTSFVYFRFAISFILIGLYLLYVILTLKSSKRLVSEGHGVISDNPLFFKKIGLSHRMSTIIIQMIAGIILLIVSAKVFIHNIEIISVQLHISALVLSLLIIPIATELPEKVNSITWALKNKDTLAWGNITGSMTFQGTLLPAIGILLTPWQANAQTMMGILITIFAVSWLRLNVSDKGIPIPVLFVNGFFYLLYLCWVIFSIHP